MPVPQYRAPKDSKPWGLLGYLKDIISPPGYVPSGPFGMRSAAAAEVPTAGIGSLPAGYKEAELAAGRAAEAFRPGAGFPGQQTAIVIGTQDGVTPDRTKSDTYKQYALNPQGQFERYFQTPEMDQYFGAASRGAAAPKSAEAMQALASQTMAPGKTPQDLSAFYRAESAMGRAQMPIIQKELGPELSQWAAANPMLAQRLYVQRQAKKEAAGQATPITTYTGVTSQPIPSQDFAIAANAVPAPWNEQGAKVSAEFSGVVPFQAAKTTGEGMPNFPTTGQKAEDFLSKVKLGTVF